MTVPRLRFSEFRDSGEWVEKSINDVCKTFSGGTPSTSEKGFYGGNISFIRSAEIDKSQTELFLTNEGLANSSAKLVKKGDVLVALYGANSGDVALAKLDGAINQAILCLKSDNSNQFIYQYLCLKEDWIVSTYIQGGQGNLSGEIIKSLRLGFPTKLEQQKIADCLSSLDELITAQTRKLDTLKTHKKGLMQQLFPVEGETLPRLRFPEFRDAGKWKEKRLIDICDINPSNEHLPQSFIYIDLESVVAGKLLYKKKIELQDAPSRAQRLLKNGDIIYQIVRPYQRNNFFCDFDDENHYVASTGYAQLRSFGESKFLYQLIHADTFVNKVIAKCTGSNYPAINSSDLAEINVATPKLPEQQKIADCLSSLDELITAQTQKLDTLQVHKKGLMQQLFPSIKEL
ncbi:MAG: restriction endonuclease subunit S [Chlorobiaceae bacterium]